jgi:hypothetical protein
MMSLMSVHNNNQVYFGLQYEINVVIIIIIIMHSFQRHVNSILEYYKIHVVQLVIQLVDINKIL